MVSYIHNCSRGIIINVLDNCHFTLLLEDTFTILFLTIKDCNRILFILFHPSLCSTNMYAQLFCSCWITHTFINLQFEKPGLISSICTFFSCFYSYTSLHLSSIRGGQFLHIVGVWCERFKCKKSLIENVIHRLSSSVLINCITLFIFIKCNIWQTYYSIYKLSSIFLLLNRVSLVH